MAKNRSKKKDSGEYSEENKSGLKTQTKHGILAVIFFVAALFFAMSAFGKAGIAGRFMYEKLYYLLGFGYILLPALLVLLGSSFLKSETPNIGLRSLISGTMFLLSGLGLIDIASGADTNGVLRHGGGFLGRILSTPLVAFFDTNASIIFLGAILIISILIIFDAKLSILPFLKKVWNLIRKALGFRQLGTSEEEKVKIEKSVEEPPIPENTETEEEQKETTSEKIKKALGVGKKNNEENESSDRATYFWYSGKHGTHSKNCTKK